ncbi:DUF1674 domain-containing protein [Methylocella sp.]|uniref:DUF1674 domain-containing protein n=1 Tax=Methylocella sp. TaxID=1978226 RepID=UPI0037852F36
MTDEDKTQTPKAGEAAPARELPAAARRALAEAEERRRLADAARVERPKEIDGRDGPEPVRYGDWEVKGIASDF